MAAPILRLSFLDGDDGGPAPQLRAGPDPGAAPIALSDRARWLLAAIALPRELAPDTASDERQRMRLGSRLWSSGEIMARIPYQHRSTIRHALSDLRARLSERELALEDYLSIDTDRGCYGLHAGRVIVDLVELHAARHDPHELDRRLDGALGDRRRARLAPICAGLLADPVHHELDAAISSSGARASAAIVAGREADRASTGAPTPAAVTPVAPEATAVAPEPAPAAPEPAPEPAPAAPEPAPAAPGPAPVAPGPAPVAPGPSLPAGQTRDRDRSRARGRSLLLPALVAVLIVALAAALIPMLASGKDHDRIHGLGPPRREVSGGVAHTWSNPHLAGGRAGPEISKGERVLIDCRLRGFKVPDGNVWWYLIDSPPWSRRFFVTADTFYNNGQTHGSLRGSAFVDPRVARCS